MNIYKKAGFFIFFTVLSIFIAGGLFAQEHEGPLEAELEEEVAVEGEIEIEDEEPGSLEEMSEEEMIEELKETLDDYEELVNFIPALKRQEDEEGKALYLYTSEDGVTRKLEELDKPTLVKLYRRVSSEANRLDTERIIRQLEQIKEAQEIPELPPEPPKVVAPPDLPQTPTTPPGTPTPPPVPSAPPAEPQRR